MEAVASVTAKRARLSAVWLVFLVLVSGCAGGGRNAVPGRRPVDFVRAFEKSRRQKAELVADHMQIRVSKELFDRFAILSAKGIHEVQREVVSDGVRLRYRNKSGGLDRPLEFRFGAAHVLVLGTADLKLLDRGKAILDVVLRGKVEGVVARKSVRAASLQLLEAGWEAGR